MKVPTAIRIAGTFRPQTDHGNIFFKSPSEIQKPKSVEALARTLADYHKRGVRVKIRNTAHSTNGQTLSSGVQVDVSGIDYAKFDSQRNVVTAGTGASWRKVITCTTFPAVCPPIFPNNPHQKIQVGGTAAVGGVGPYVSSQGGFWNHVSALKLVTMKGDVIPCSREENPDLFRYSLGGFGRVGVIAEVTLDVIPSRANIVVLALAYSDEGQFFADFQKALNDPALNGVFAQQDLSGWEFQVLEALGIKLYLLVVMFEVTADEDFKQKADSIKARYNEQLSVFIKAGANVEGLDLSLTARRVSKRDLVFYAPVDSDLFAGLKRFLARIFFGASPHPKKMANPWSDCVIDRKNYLTFIDQTKAAITSSGLAQYLEKESFIGSLFDLDTFVTFGIKNMNSGDENGFPLSLDLPQEREHSMGVAIMPIIPKNLVKDGLKLSKTISDLVYELGGRRYLYGVHDLTQAQVEQHFTRPVLEKWQRLKDEYDPKHLLNIDVIEHLDAS